MHMTAICLYDFKCTRGAVLCCAVLCCAVLRCPVRSSPTCSEIKSSASEHLCIIRVHLLYCDTISRTQFGQQPFGLYAMLVRSFYSAAVAQIALLI